MNIDIDQAVILAAGRSKRLSPYIRTSSKLTTKIGRFPLILYPISVLAHENVKEFCLVANRKNYPELLEITNMVSNVDFNILINSHPELGNGYSFLLCRKCVSNKYFLLSMGDHIYSPSIVRKLKKAMSRDIDLLVGADSKPRYIDVKEATKIYAPNNKVQRIGKQLKRFTHIDIGVFIVKNTVFELFESEDIREPFTFSNIVRAAVRGGFNVVTVDINGDYWTEIDTKGDLDSVLWGDRKVVLETVWNMLKERYEHIFVIEKLEDETI